MPSSHLILCRPLLLLPPIPPSIRVFSNESILRMRWPLCATRQCNRLPRWLSGKESTCQAGGAGLIHGLGRFLGGENDNPFQYSCLGNPMDNGAWLAIVHGVTKSRIQLSDFTFTFHFDALEKEMATHSSVLAWRIPGTGEPCGLPSTGLCRVRHD